VPIAASPPDAAVVTPVGRASLGDVLLAWSASPPEHRHDTGRRLMRELARELGAAASVDIVSVCTRCGGAHGRPRVTAGDIAVSVTYAGDLVVAAAAPHDIADEIGVDAENEGADAASPLADLAPLFAPAPPPTTVGWTQIEAALKADGRGIRVPVGDVVVGEAVPSALPGAVAVTVPGRAEPVHVATWHGIDGVAVSVAIVASSTAEP